MDDKKYKKLHAIVSKGKWNFVIMRGALGFGITAMALIISYDWYELGRYPFENNLRYIVMWLIAGPFWGITMWHYLTRQTRKYESRDTSNSG